MKLSCPSCGASHDTSEYPNAFEINCVCGYSILVPAEVSVTRSKSHTTFDRAAPSAMDAEDDALLIRPEGLMALDSSEKENVDAGGVLQMTPSDQLPPGMVYDSFELPSAGDLDLGNKDVFEAGAQSPEILNTPTQDLEASVDATANVAAAPEILVDQSKAKAEPVIEKNKPAPAQVLVDRVQMSSMGQFLGRDYRLSLESLTPQQIEFFMTIIGRMLRERPWLESECKKREIDFKKQFEQGLLQNIPELIALEIYLTSFKLGVSCHYEIVE